MTKRRLGKLLATTALVALLGGAEEAAAKDFTGIYMFGDSFSDNGNLHRLNPQAFAAPYWQGRPSNGPTWIEYLRRSLGLAQTGNGAQWNFAIAGGATDTMEANNQFAFGLLGNLQVGDQNGGFVRNHGRLGDRDLVVLNGGGNDTIRAVLVTGTVRSAADYDGLTQSIIGNMKTAITRLAAKGAKTIVVANQQDLAEAPGVVDNPNLNAAQRAQLLKLMGGATRHYNAALTPAMQALAKELGIRIVTVDVMRMNDLTKSIASRYGFTDIDKICMTDGTQVRNAQGTFDCAGLAKWDGVHNTTRAHELIAEYALATIQMALDSPASIATANQFGIAMSEVGGAQLDARLGEVAEIEDSPYAFASLRRTEKVRYADAGPYALVASDALPTLIAASARKSGLAAFLKAGYGDGDRDATETRSGFDYRAWSAVAGLDYALDPTTFVGTAFGYTDMRSRLDDAKGGADVHSYSFSVFGVKLIDALRLESRVGAAIDRYEDIRRATGFAFEPTAHGKTRGYTFSASGKASYAIPLEPVTLEPFVGLRFARVGIRSYEESGTVVMNMEIGDQRSDRLVASGGVEAVTRFEWEGVSIAPRIRLAVERDLVQDSSAFTYGLTGSQVFEGTVREPKRTVGKVGTGIDLGFGPGLVSRVGYETTFAGIKGRDQLVSAQISFAF